MKLYQRTNPDGSLITPYWYFDIVVDGARKRRSTKKTKKAEAKAVMLAELNAKPEPVVVVEAKPLTVLAAMQDYMADLESRKCRTDKVASLIDKTFGFGSFTGTKDYTLPRDLTVAEFSKTHIKAIQRARAAEGLAQGTIAQSLKVMRSALIASGEAPALRWEIQLPKESTRWLSREEWQRVLAELDPDRPMEVLPNTVMSVETRMEARIRDRDVFLALTMMGGRLNEVLRMTVNQVAVEGEMVRSKLFATKTGKERMVPVPPEMAEMLTRRRAAAIEAGTDYLFPSPRVDGPIRNVQNIREAIKRAGVNDPAIVAGDGKVVLHTLRHTFASWLYQAGVPLEQIKDLLGHSNISQTLRYAHNVPEAVVDNATAVMTKLSARAMAPANVVDFGTVAAQKEARRKA